MGNNTADAATQFLANRLLLTPALAKAGYPEQLMFATTNYSAGESEVRLTLTAPGMPGMTIDHLRSSLNAALAESLWTVGCRWLSSATIETDTASGQPEIVVDIDDAAYRGKAARLVLEATRLFLDPAAGLEGRQVVVLGRDQRLVPLDFEFDTLRGSLALQLPKQLELAQPRMVAASRSDDPAQAGREFLQEALQYALDTFPGCMGVLVQSKHELSAHISISFDTRRGGPNASARAAARRTISQVVNRHARLPEGKFLYNRLVFIPAWPVADDADDGIYDEDRGWLGEFAEY